MTRLVENPLKTRTLGKTGLRISEIGLGTSSLGNLYSEVTEVDALSTVRAAWEMGIRYFDTAPYYGLGISETRTGLGLTPHNRSDYLISSKVGRVLIDAPAKASRYGFVNTPNKDIRFDYSYDGVMKSFSESCDRLKTDRIDILLFHDLGKMTHGDDAELHFCQAMEGGYRALQELRTAGAVTAIGLGVNEVEVCERALDGREWDCFLLAGRYTLLEHGGTEELFQRCMDTNTSLIIGGVYNSGILATGSAQGPLYYDYKPAPNYIVDRVQRIEKVCSQRGVPLAAAALQLPSYHPAVSSILPGMANPAWVSDTLRYYRWPIPESFWSDLKDQGLLPYSLHTKA